MRRSRFKGEESVIGHACKSGRSLHRIEHPRLEAVLHRGLRVWIVVAWIALPTVMYGGHSLLRLINRGEALTPFQVSWLRADHAHAGVLLLMSPLYYVLLDNASLSLAVKHAACVVLFLGVLAQPGEYFVHMIA